MHCTTVLLVFALLFYQSCTTDNSLPQPTADVVQPNINNSDLHMLPKKLDQLIGKVQLKTIDAETLEASYSVTNSSTDAYLMFNSGDVDNNYAKETYYVELQSDGVTEISQRLFRSPTDPNCPDRITAFVQGITILKPRQTVARTIKISLPLLYNNPRAVCSLRQTMPEQSKKAKFCLGLLKADEKTGVKKGLFTIFGSDVNVQNQQLICSDVIKLQ